MPRAGIRSGTLALILLAGCGKEVVHPPRAGDAGRVADAAPPAIEWTSCKGTFECASLDVPIDYGRPRGATIPLGLIRAPAKNPDLRIGSIVVNPGGPGTPTLENFAERYALLGVAFARAIERFDIVGFDWRNIGSSNPIQCVDDAFLDSVRQLDLGLGTPGDLPVIEARRRELVDGCRDGNNEAVLTNLHTENAARDLDRIRAALDEQKLNYLGLSYGSWLGAKYATLFPERVRALVLDAPISAKSSLEDVIARRATSLDDGLGRFFGSCAAAAACPFHRGSDVQALEGYFDDLVLSLRKNPVPAGDRVLSVTDFYLGVEDGLRNATWSDLAKSLTAIETGDGSGLLPRVDATIGRRPDGTYVVGLLGLLAIGCLDFPLPPGTTVETLATFVDGIGSRTSGMAALPWALCAGWPWQPASPRVDVSAHGAPPELVIAGRHDPISFFEDGAALVDQLDNGSHLVTYEGEGHVASLHSQCVRDVVTDYFVDPESPPAVTSCAQ